MLLSTSSISYKGTNKKVREAYMPTDLQLSFTDKEITPWGWLALMSRLLKKIGFREALREAGLPIQGSKRGYAPEQLIVSHWSIEVGCRQAVEKLFLKQFKSIL